MILGCYLGNAIKLKLNDKFGSTWMFLVKCALFIISSIRIQMYLSLPFVYYRPIYVNSSDLTFRRAVHISKSSKKRTMATPGALKKASWWSTNNSRKRFKTQIDKGDKNEEAQ